MALEKIIYRGETLFSPTYDPLFKGIFLSNGCAHLASFLSCALKKDIRPGGITVNNTELHKNNVKDKGVRLDLKVTLADGSIINVEMQVGNEYNMGKRTVYNLSRIMAGQVEVSEDYKNICPVIAINILGFNYIRNNDDFHNRYRMANLKTGAEMPNAEVFEVNFIELPKLPKDAGGDLFTLWLKFLAAKKEEDLDMVIAQEPTIFGVAVSQLRKLSADAELRERQYYEDKYRMDRVSALAQSKREGKKETQIETAFAMKAERFDDDLIAKITKLPIEEIRKL